MPKVFLFPLNNSLLMKKVTLPYHIFEPRYLQMIQDAKDDDIELSVLYPLASSNYRGKYVVAGKPLILRDGDTLDIVITGEKKYRLIEEVSSDPYLCYEAEVVNEVVSLNQSDMYDYNTLKNILMNFLKSKNVEFSNPEFKRLLQDPEFVVSYATLFLIQSKVKRQEILDSMNLNEKINNVLDYLAKKKFPNIHLAPLMKK